MAFDVSPDAYGRFMGRYSRPLATAFADLVGVRRGQRALDVGCGPGALTAVLADRLGPDLVTAADPSEPFVAAVRRDLPGVTVARASAEQLPYDDASFDLVLAQLVVHLMGDAVAGLAEMARVTAPGGTVAASVWDFAGDRSPLSPFWRAARDVDPAVVGESDLAGVAEGGLADLFERVGMTAPRSGALTVRVTLAGFEEWWDPFQLGVGPAGDYLRSLAPDVRDRVRARCRSLLPEQPLTVEATAWTALWHKPTAA